MKIKGKYIIKIRTVVFGMLLFFGLLFLMPTKTARAETASPILHSGGYNTTVDNLGYGKFNVRSDGHGFNNDGTSSYVYFDKIEIPENKKIYISIDMHSFPYFNDVDSWLAFCVGSDASVGMYHPASQMSGTKGAYYTQLMRFNRNGTISGNWFNSGRVQGDFTTIESYSFQICLDYSGGDVKVFLNGVEDKSFTKHDAENCYISFVSYSVASGDVFDYDVTVGTDAVAANSEYDLSKNANSVDVTLKLMGNDVQTLKILDENQTEVPSDKYSVNSLLGTETLRLTMNKSLLSGEENGQRTFYIQNPNGMTSFIVETVDYTVVNVLQENYDICVAGEHSLSFSAGTLTDVKIYDGVLNDISAYIQSGKIVFPEGYFTEKGYGTYVFYAEGVKASGILSARTSFAVTVYDSRLPAFTDATVSVDCAIQTNALVIPFRIYDGKIAVVRLNGKILLADKYALTAETFSLDVTAVDMMSYGENTLTVSTDKGAANIIIEKTDSRTPILAQNVTVDTAAGKSAYVIEMEFYGKQIVSVQLGGKILDDTNWLQVPSGLKINADILTLGLDGLDLVVRFDSKTLYATLYVINSSVPNVLTTHHYDKAQGNAVQVVFADVYCEYLFTEYNGVEFNVATFADNTVSIPAAWFAQKINDGVYAIGDRVSFVVVWKNIYTQETLYKEVSVSLYDSDEIYNRLPTMDKKNGTFSLPLFLNGYAMQYITINGEYVTDYILNNETITFDVETMLAMPTGDLTVCVYTTSQIQTFTVKLEDSRSIQPSATQASYYQGGAYPDGFLFAVKLYGNTVLSITELGGKTIASFRYQVTQDGIIFETDYLDTKKTGEFNFFITTSRINGDLEKRETTAVAFTIDTFGEIVLQHNGIYDLKSADVYSITVDFDGGIFIGMLENGNLLNDAYYMQLQRNLVVLNADYLHTLSVGEHRFTVKTNKTEKDFTLVIKDTRTNSFALQTLSVNKGARDIVLYATINNAQFSLSLDGRTLTANDYRVEDSYIILKENLVQSLSGGEYSLRMTVGENTSNITIKIFDGAYSYTLPIIIAVASVSVVFIGIYLLVFVARKKKGGVK